MNPNYSEFKFPHIKANQWNKVFGGTNNKKPHPHAISLVSNILKYNPEQRPKPLQALQHPFFEDLRQADCKLPNGTQLI